MEINEKNKTSYEKAFITEGEFGKAISKPSWKPDIDENEISDWSGDSNDNWVPATPLGYRDYSISRSEGIKNILNNQEDYIDLTGDKLYQVKKSDNLLKKYDKIHTNSGDFIVIKDTETRYYVIDINGNQYYVDYMEE